LDALWQRLGVTDAITRAAGAASSPQGERMLLCLGCNRALAPSSKLAALAWAAGDVALPGVGELGNDPQVFDRAMDLLLDADEPIQRAVFVAVANPLSLDVDGIVFDTTMLLGQAPTMTGTGEPL
jgi:hypothetical protein